MNENDRSHRDAGRAELSRRIAMQFPETPRLEFEDFCSSVFAVHDVFAGLGCPVYNRRLPSQQWYDDYIDEQPNIKLVEATLDRDTHGAVIKHKIPCEHGRPTNTFVLVISQRVSGIDRLLTIAHELGHIFLHGRLLRPGMLLQRRHMHWYREERPLRYQMEAEANIYALLSLIPSAIIDGIRLLMGQRVQGASFAGALGYAVGCLYQTPIALRLIKERLLIEEVFHRYQEPLAHHDHGDGENAALRATFEQCIDSDAWLLNSGMARVPRPTQRLVSMKCMCRLVDALVRNDTMTSDQAERTLRYAAHADQASSP